nr:MAG TPA: protein of unknown function (DUF5047) [Caudoviricetes sp.]
MPINVGQDDYNILSQQIITKYIKLEILNFQYNVVDEISGNLTAMSVNIDSGSDLRRSCNLTFVVTDASFDVKAGNKIWLDKFCRPWVGYENIYTGKIQWYNQGIYLINAPSWRYNATTHELSLAGLDLASKLTGLRNGELEGIPTKIPSGSSVREAMIAAIELAGFTKYTISECKDVDGNIIAVPNDIEIAQGGTVWNIVTQLRDILPRYETFFDVDGVFIYQPIPTGSGDPVIIDDTIWTNLLIDESINNDFESVKNYIEVYGRTLDPSYFSTNTTYSGSTLSLTVADYPAALTDNTIVGFTTSSTGDISATGSISLKMNSLAASVLYEYGTNNPVTTLDNDTYYVVYYNQGWYLMGHQQPVGIAYDDNPDSPFYVNGSIGRIRHVLYGGEYENITSDKLALERAKYELWKRTRLQDSITLTSIPNPWLDVNILISHAIRGKSQENAAQYIIKSISTDYGIEGTQSINAITYYPLYPDI